MKAAIMANKRIVTSQNRSWLSTATSMVSPVQQYRDIGATPKVIKDAVANPSNPRTLPRAVVLASAGAFFGYMTYKTFTYREHHFDERKNVINVNVPPRPSGVVKAVADNAPIAMNAQRYASLRKGGLGVDEEDFMAKKIDE